MEKGISWKQYDWEFRTVGGDPDRNIDWVYKKISAVANRYRFFPQTVRFSSICINNGTLLRLQSQVKKWPPANGPAGFHLARRPG